MKHAKTLVLAIALFFSFTGTAFSQVGIGTTSPNAGSILELSSPNQGLLLPRITLANRPASTQGMLFYQTDGTSGLYYNNGTLNTRIGCGDGTITSITVSSPLTGGTITSAGTIGISQANTTTSGFLSTTDWNTFNGKLSASGGTMTGKLNTAASTATTAGLNIPHGAAPTTPLNGDLWTTTTGLFARINGATIGPFSTSGSVFTLTGNAGTNPSVNFLGTTDAQPIVVKTDNAERMRIASDGKIGVGTGTPTSGFTIANSSIALPYKNVTANYTANGTDYTMTSSNNIAISLPAASTCPGRVYIVCALAANQITVDPNGTEVIYYDGGTVTTLLVGNSGTTTDSMDQIMFQCTGTAWIVLSVH